MKRKYTLLFAALSFTFTAAAQHPGGVLDSLTCWLRANDGITLNATNQVVTWNEYSGNPTLGNFSTQGAAINKPTHVAPTVDPDGINFNPYVQFNSTSTPNSISSANAVTGTSFLDPTKNTIFQVINLKQATGTGVWVKWQYSANPYSSPRLGNEINNGSNPGQVRFDFRNNNLYSASNILNQHTLMTQRITSTDKIIRLTGMQNAITATTGTFSPSSSTGKLTLGAEPYGDDYPTNVDIAEFIIYKRELTEFEIQKIESYLAIKYGVTLDQNTANNNYYASNGTVLWNSTANTGYRNNITGIGRDDASALNQKQSRSINNGSIITIYKGNSYTAGFPTENNLNTNNFSSDGSYLVFGDNNGGLVMNNCGDNGRVVRINRAWKMIATGNDGLATIAGNKSFLPANITHLLVADDENFNVNAQTVALNDDGTQLFAAYNFTGIKYFTFSSEPINLNAIIDTVCFGGKGNIITNPVGGFVPISYSWNSVPVQNTHSLVNVTPGNYTVTINQGGICTYTETHSILGSPSSVGIHNVIMEPSICTSQMGSIQVYAMGGTSPYTYSINDGLFQTSASFNNLRAGKYKVTVKDALGCTAEIVLDLSAEQRELTPTVETKDAWCDAGGGAGYALIKPESGTAPYTYTWDNGIGLHGNIHNNLTKGKYTVKVADYFGCEGSVTFDINEIPCCTYHIVNAFSPNNDGLNDIFVGYTTTPIPQFVMKIFDRWGATVFVSGNYDKGWDGKDYKSGIDREVGVYYYYIEYLCPLQNEKQILKGEVTLMR